jgi:iron-sulfur cluster repair protein YtfE (RIC family)
MFLKNFIKAIAGATVLALPVAVPDSAAAQGASTSVEHSNDKRLTIPSSIVTEHKKLHVHLARVLKSGGRTGAAVKEVERLLHPHFVKEEQFALPPLGLLSSVAFGAAPADAKRVISMSERLKAELPEMLREHKEITAALQQLLMAARDERKSDAVQFADDLIAHATQEEQILYPSAILVGEYLKLKQ